jgi:hypothetical protein
VDGKESETLKVKNMEVAEKQIQFYVKEITWLRGISTGWGNGYVCLPKGHPCFGLDYDAIHEKYPDLSVHGGLTFACASEDIVLEKVPELPEACRKDYWIIGFDCAHYGDDLSMWPKVLVEHETKNLARQMEQIAKLTI